MRVLQPERGLACHFAGVGDREWTLSAHQLLKVDAVDIVPEVLDCFRDFHPDAEQWTKRPRAYQHVDDGRHFLLIHPQKYDVITIDPAPPLHSAGTVNLYTKEFFELAKQHLNPGGIVTQFVQLYESNEEAVKSEIAAVRASLVRAGQRIGSSLDPDHIAAIAADRAFVIQEGIAVVREERQGHGLVDRPAVASPGDER